MVDVLIEQHMKGPVGRMGDMFPEGGTRPEYSEPDPTLVGLYLNVCDRIFGGGKDKVVDEVEEISWEKLLPWLLLHLL